MPVRTVVSMTTTQLPTPVTPAAVLAAAAEHVGSLDAVWWAARTPGELLDGVVAVEQLRAHLDAVQLAMVAEIDATDAAKTRGWASTKDFLTHVAGHGPATVRLARRMQALPRVAAALAEGSLTRVKAEIIADGIDRLPTNPELRDRAEEHLVAAARVHDPRELRRLTRRVWEVVDPDGVDREAEKALDREERAAQLGRHLVVQDDGYGGCGVQGSGTAEDAALLRAVLLSLAAPAVDVDGTRDVRDHGARMWDALMELCRGQVAAGGLPRAHGSPVRLLVTLGLDQLKAGLGDGVTGTGESLSATTIRRLACDAEVIPAVLGSQGQLLDVGHTQRLVTTAIFLALILRDRHCAFPGCTRPPVMCHAHHIRHWADGGPTSAGQPGAGLRCPPPDAAQHPLGGPDGTRRHPRVPPTTRPRRTHGVDSRETTAVPDRIGGSSDLSVVEALLTVGVLVAG